jgi:hydrophobe/amphiphile efflux-1 (HAE1) family protein
VTLSDVAIRRPVFTAMLSLAIIVLGALSYQRLAVELYPPVNFPILLVTTVYPGAGPEDIERDVTEPVEDAVSGISGIQKLQSFTRDSVSVVVVQFGLNADLDASTNLVRDRVGAVEGQLPSGAEKPVIRQVDIGALPIVVVALSTNGSVNEARQLADDRLRPFLEQVDGVGTVNVVGGQDREIHVDLDLDALAALQVPATDVAQRLGVENLSIPAGQIALHDFSIAVRTVGQYRSVADLASTVVKQTADGRFVRLGEVARVQDDWSRPTRHVRNNGKDAVTLEIVKKSGANTVDVAHAVRARMAEVVPGLGKGAAYEVIVDQSREIEANAHEVWIAIFFGGAMAVLVILFFLMDWRGTLISALALPTSVIGTFAAMDALGFSFNTMTLMGLSLAIGLLIDDAVVVRESITRRLEAGDPPEVAASRGTSEIALAVLATTLSLVAVFVPVAFMSGMVGQFFKQFGLTIAVAVMLSLWVAFTLDPMLSARLSVRHEGPRTGLSRVVGGWLDALDDGYRWLLDRALRNRWKTVMVAVAVMVGTFAIGAFIPVEFVPKQDRGEVIADIRLPVGTDLEVTDEAARGVEARLLAIPGVVRVYSIVGHEDQSHRARFRVLAIDKTERSEPLSYFEDRIREVLSTVPRAEVSLQPPSIIEGLGDWPPFMLIVQGDDLAGLLEEGERIRKLVAEVPGTSDVRLTVNPGRPELRVDVDRDLAADRGVPPGLVGMTLRTMLEGQVVGALRDGGPEAEIRLRAEPRYVRDGDAIAGLLLPSPRGTVSIGDVAKVAMGAAASEITHHNRLRAVTVWSQLAHGAALGTVLDEVFLRLDQDPVPDGYLVTMDGQARDMKETGAAMGLAIAVAFMFIFMVLASQFESLFHPFTLMASVPLAMVGAFLALAVTGSSISMGSQIGIILLMGLVTKNAILLVDGALVHRREGLDPVESMRRAGPRRLRPIVMTSMAMALGMMPTALGTGIGAEFRAPMAIAVIGGVLSSTMLTLLVVPVAFVWMEKLRGLFSGRARGVAPVGVEGEEAAK